MSQDLSGIEVQKYTEKEAAKADEAHKAVSAYIYIYMYIYTYTY
jgi:hypothetical protein